MTPRYTQAPVAAHDPFQIWRYSRKLSSIEMADRVEHVIRDKIVFLARTPGIGERT